MNDIDMWLSHHLTHNCYPSPPACFVGLCNQAIDAFLEEDYERMIVLPYGVTWRDNEEAPASALVKNFNLWYFINQPEHLEDAQ